MARRWSDSFDRTSTLTDEYEAVSGSPSASSTKARTGSKSLRLNNANYVEKQLGTNEATLTVGLAWNVRKW